MTTSNYLNETQCLGLAICLRGAVTPQLRAGTAGFTFHSCLQTIPNLLAFLR